MTNRQTRSPHFSADSGASYAAQARNPMLALADSRRQAGGRGSKYAAPRRANRPGRPGSRMNESPISRVSQARPVKLHKKNVFTRRDGAYRQSRSARPGEQKRFYKKPAHSAPINVNQVSNGILRIIPLGGCEEVGRNMTVFEYNEDIVIIDMGMQFPEEDTPGIDYMIPNTEYLKGREKNIRGVIFTHGHLDHIGATPLLLEKLRWPLVVSSKFTVYMIKDRVEDYQRGAAQNVKAVIINNFNESLKLGNFQVKFFEVSHTIMDAMGIILETPAATVIHPGDWKFKRDANNQPLGYDNLDKLKKPTVLMLESLAMSYKKQPVPEEEMYKNIEKLVAEAPGRIIIATFSSNVERAAVILSMAAKYGKKVAIDGYSMKKNINIAKEMGYTKMDLRNVIDVKQAHKVRDENLIVICTGAQGEDRAVLNRIANGQHRFINFKKQDTVIFSSSVVPGNERTVQRLKDLIYRQSDHVIHSDLMDVHSGGHGNADDVKEILLKIKPTYFIPVYANHFMLKEAFFLARKLGWKESEMAVPDNGSVIEITPTGIKKLDKKVPANPVFVDGLGISDTQNVVLRDRQILAEDGMVVVIATLSGRNAKLIHSPDIISRGFIYLKENKKLIADTRQKVREIVSAFENKKPLQDEYIKNKIRNDLGQFLFNKTAKRPMILPVVIEV